MPDFARRLLAAYRGTPEETTRFWGGKSNPSEEWDGDLDFPESDRDDYFPPRENLTGSRSHMLGHCGRHTLPCDPDQEPEEWEEDWR